MHSTSGQISEPAALMQCAQGTVLIIHQRYGPELVQAVRQIFHGKRIVDDPVAVEVDLSEPVEAAGD